MAPVPILPTLPWDVIDTIIGYYTGSNLDMRSVSKQMYECIIKHYCSRNTITATKDNPELLQHAETLRIMDDSISLSLINPINLWLSNEYKVSESMSHMTRLRTLSAGSISYDSLCGIPNLTELDFRYPNEYHNINNLTTLRTLTLRDDYDISEIPLHKLNIIECCEVIEVPSTVRELTVIESDCPEICGQLDSLSLVIDEFKTVSVDWIPHTYALTKLVSGFYCNIPSNFLDGCKQLHTLELVSPQTEDIQSLLAPIPSFTSLVRLCIYKADAMLPVDFLHRLTSLTDLQLCVNADVSISCLTSLRRLEMRSSSITDQDLLRNTSLNYLKIDMVELGGGYSYVARITNEGLKPLVLLEDLELERNPYVTDEGIKHLINLKRVCIKNSYITPHCETLIHEYRYNLTGDYGLPIHVCEDSDDECQDSDGQYIHPGW